MINYLNTEVKKRLGQYLLIQLTNYDVSQTTIKEDTLDSASADAIGIFRVVTGVEPEVGNFTHTSILIKGIQYYLELYKGRDTALIRSMEQMFFRDCIGIRERIYVSPSTNSNIEDVDREMENDKTKDFAKNNRIFPINRINKSYEVKEF
jgi:hypothetical protein